MEAIHRGERMGIASPPSCAVVWINGRSASIVATQGDGPASTCEVARGFLSEGAYLAKVVRAIDDRERVAILGPGSARLALERAYVELFRTPERLVDVEPAGLMSRADLVDRLRTLAG